MHFSKYFDSPFSYLAIIWFRKIETGWLFLFLLILTFSSCKQYPVFSGDYTIINVGPGPEYMALDTTLGEKRLIVSCDERRTDETLKNGFYDFNFQTKKAIKLNIEGFPKDISLHPHGIDIALVNDKKLLYCVNHEKNEVEFPPAGRQSILVFELLMRIKG